MPFVRQDNHKGQFSWTDHAEIVVILEASLAYCAPVSPPVTVAVHMDASELRSVELQVASFTLMLWSPVAVVLDVLIVLILVVELHLANFALEAFSPV